MQHVSRDKWRKLWLQIGPSLRLFGRLRTRLERIGMSPGDRYYREVCAAYNAIHGVSVRTYYASCEGGVAGADERREDDATLWLGDGI